ncbi:CBS domain-containing protein [Hyalangium rubrum]|uniref:CBS domain-containing protein n=1 Tax=Hyalangium rubrum TaxID=3103134 RepID=A0ABU5HD23_9BACT|nr:CBS domain-containing protein [Hyalangium sp. s54d21]MDY7231364.1 CBS domain-containing protein [Hyalangium sp. s54d21]
MADRRTDNGRDDARSAQQQQRSGMSDVSTGMMGSASVPSRSPDVAPPGSRERSESDVTGYSPARDEDPAMRQGRFHRAAAMRLAQPRTSADMGTGLHAGTPMGTTGHMGSTRPDSLNRDDRAGYRGSDMRELGYGGADQRGPYGRDDRDDRYASGVGTQMRMGEQDIRHSLEMRRDTGGENFRPWDRTGYGADERQLREERGQYSSGQYGSQGRVSGERYDPMLGMGHASPGQPGMGVNLGQGGTYTARSGDTGRMGMGSTDMGTGRRRWQREPLTAREVMTRGIKTVRRDSPLRDVAQIMKDEDCGVVPIVDDKGTLVGIITDRDMVIRAFTGGKTPDQLRAGDVMTDDVECVHPEESIHSVIELMGKRQIRRIPVVERDDRVVGLISMGDIANRADYDEELQEALDRVSSKRSFWSRLT